MSPNTGEHAVPVLPERVISSATGVQIGLVCTLVGGLLAGTVAFTRAQSDVEHLKTDAAAYAQAQAAQLQAQAGQIGEVKKELEAEKEVHVQARLEMQQMKDTEARILESLGELKATQRETLRALDVRSVGTLKPSRHQRRPAPIRPAYRGTRVRAA